MLLWDFWTGYLYTADFHLIDNYVTAADAQEAFPDAKIRIIRQP